MKYLKPAIFWTVQLILVFGLVETICYFFLKMSHNPLYRARRVLEQNEIWGWQLKPELNTEFEDKKIYTDQFGFRQESLTDIPDLEKVELLTLGPSSAFGWGVRADDTYTAKIAKQLSLNYLNASQIGFSSWQGLLLWDYLLKDKLPNLKYVIISYGINDLDKFRFFDSEFSDDLHYFKLNDQNHKKLSGGTSTSLAKTLNLLKNEAAIRFNCSALANINQRMSFSESKLALKAFISEFKRNGVKVIVVNTPYQRMPANEDFKYDLIGELYSSVQREASSGNCREALNWLIAAKSLEPWRIEYDVVTLSILQESLSKEEGVTYIDAHAEFENLEDQKDYFVDPVHPSALGHNLIANAVLSRLK